MIVCYLGPFDPVLTRNRVIIKGLMRNNVDLVQCNTFSSNRMLDYVKTLKHLRLDYDIIMLGARGDRFGQPLVPIFKKITRKPIVFDAMITLFETFVVDRRTVAEGSVKSKLWHLLDYAGLDNADLVLSDTEAHSRYYAREYNVDFKKFRRVFIGTDDDAFYPRKPKTVNDCFLVMFWGGFIPLHGIEYIVRAAKLLEDHADIRFELRGYGQTYNSIVALISALGLKNISLNPVWVTYEELPNHIARADVCLGNFGATDKAKRVITAKSVDTIAMKKPLITGDSPAAREIFKDKDNCFLVPMANAKALADAILTLKNDDGLRRKIAQNGYNLYKEKLTPQVIGKELKADLIELVDKDRA